MPKKTTKLPAKLVKYLDQAGINHEILEHKTVYTAIDAANTMKKKLSDIAKTLVIKADRDYYIVLLPADQEIDFEKLRKSLSSQYGKEVKVVKIPGEAMMEKATKVKAGALTAFGKLHKLPVVIDKKLAEAKKAVFSSGSLNHSVEMSLKDFKNLEDIVVANFSKKKKIKAQKIHPSKKKKATAKKTVAKKKPVAKKTVAKKKAGPVKKTGAKKKK